MMRAGSIVLLLALALTAAACSKCDTSFGTPGACHSETPSVR
jgi:hypothetical protein